MDRFQDKTHSGRNQITIQQIISVTQIWELVKKNQDLYREMFSLKYLDKHSKYVKWFPTLVSKSEQQVVKEAVFIRHSTAIINFIDALIEFMNGNEDSKPVLYVLGKIHKKHQVTERMFIEMKDAIVTVLEEQESLNSEASEAWSRIIEYIMRNYIFKGMQM